MAENPVQVHKGPAARSLAPDPWQALRSEMDRVFDRFGGGFGFPSMRRMFDLEPGWRSDTAFSFAPPAVDISDDERAYKIEAELPGLDQKDVDVSMNGDMLVLKGEKRQERDEKQKNRHLSERSYGAFERRFAIPDDVDRDKISAQFSKGVLTVMLPKSENAQKRQKKIEVKAT